MRYKAMPGDRFDHQRRQVISDFPRPADGRLATHQAHIIWWFGSELPPIPSVSRFPQKHFGLGGGCG